ncbi:MAG: family 10 glycosylhydrolase [Sodaliphilus sp.]
MKLFRLKNFVRTCSFAIVALLATSPAKATVADSIETKANWTKGWSYSQADGATLPDWLPGFDYAKNMCYGDGKLYVVDAKNTKIYVVDAKTGAKLRELDMTGVSGGDVALMDVKYVNGHILACNLAVSATGTTRVYHWEDDGETTVPSVLLETIDKSGSYRVGDTFGFTGDPTGSGYIYFVEGKYVLEGVTKNTHTNSYVLRYKVENGKCTLNASPEYTILGSLYATSPRVVPISDTQFWADDQGANDPQLYTWVTDGSATASSSDKISTNNYRGNDIKPFKLEGSDTEYAFVNDLSSSGSWYQGHTALYKKGTSSWSKVFNFDDLTEASPGTDYSNAGGGTSLAINLNNKNGVTVGMEVWYHFFREGLAYYHIGDLTPETTTDPDPEPEVDITDQKREMRSAWLTTVYNIDWPETTGNTEAVVTAQKAQLCEYLDAAKNANLNTVYFQVRSMADAMYKSSLEPWSSYLTGARGTDPGWDPLKYAVEQAHERGLRIEAWVNPYRYAKSNAAPWMASDWSNDLDQVTKSHTISYTNDDGDITILNPAEDWTITRITDVCKEIITGYKVDGLVFDDYFYPYGIPETKSAGDWSNWTAYQASGDTEFTTIGDWRRGNVNKMVAAVYNMVKTYRPDCTFGISPAGVACTDQTIADKHGVDRCTAPSGDWQYDGIYSDPVQWLEDGTVDFVSPQIYWPTTSTRSPYILITNWWTKVAKQFGRHHYASQYPTEEGNTIVTPGNVSTYGELLKEVEANRAQNKNIYGGTSPGSVFYSAQCLKKGDWGDTFRAYCAETVYPYKNLPPVLTWKDPANYKAPENLTNVDGTLHWDAISTNKLCRFAIYAVPSTVAVSDAKGSQGGVHSKYLLDFVYNPDDNTDVSFTLPTDKQSGYWYAVTAIDAANNEYDPATLGAPEGASLDFTFDIENAANQQVSCSYDDATGVYTITTVADATGSTDPFVYSTALPSATSDPDLCVVEFEYKCSGTAEGPLELFFCPESPERSAIYPVLVETSDWTTYKMIIHNEKKDFNWGAAGDKIRFDFCKNAGVTLQLKNLRIRQMTASEVASFDFDTDIIKEDAIDDLEGVGYFYKKGTNGLWYFKINSGVKHEDYTNNVYVVLKSWDDNYTKYEAFKDKYFLEWILKKSGIKVWYVRDKADNTLPFYPAIQNGECTSGTAFSNCFDVSTGFKVLSGNATYPYKMILMPVYKGIDTSDNDDPIGTVNLADFTELSLGTYGTESRAKKDTGEDASHEVDNDYFYKVHEDALNSEADKTDKNALEDELLTGVRSVPTYSHAGITDLTGIGYFTGLKKLDMGRERYGWYIAADKYVTSDDRQFSGYSALKSVDLSHNTLLEEVNLCYNNLTTLDISKLPFLKKLNVSNNANLPSLDISNNTNLQELRLEHNWEFKKLHADASANQAMKYLQIFDNMYGWEQNYAGPTASFQTDVVDKMKNLEVLHCFSMFTNELDVSSLTHLKSLWVHKSQWAGRQLPKGNWLHNLDLSQNLELCDVHVHNMHLSNLNINSTHMGEDYRYNADGKKVYTFEKEVKGDYVQGKLPGIDASNNYRSIKADLAKYDVKDKTTGVAKKVYIYFLRTNWTGDGTDEPQLNAKKAGYLTWHYDEYNGDKGTNVSSQSSVYLDNTMAEDGFDQLRTSNWRFANLSTSDISKKGVLIHEQIADATVLPVINSNMASVEEIPNLSYLADWYNTDANFKPASAMGEIVVLKVYVKGKDESFTELPAADLPPTSICYDYNLIGHTLNEQLTTPAKEGKRKALANPEMYNATFYLDIEYPNPNDQATDVIGTELGEKEVSHVTYTDLAGRVSNRPFSGVNIVTTHYTDGTSKVIKQIER